MILRRYILIFTLALISCAGTSYIHSLSEQEKVNTENISDQRVEKEVVSIDFKKVNTVQLN